MKEVLVFSVFVVFLVFSKVAPKCSASNRIQLKGQKFPEDLERGARFGNVGSSNLTGESRNWWIVKDWMVSKWDTIRSALRRRSDRTRRWLWQRWLKQKANVRRFRIRIRNVIKDTRTRLDYQRSRLRLKYEKKKRTLLERLRRLRDTFMLKNYCTRIIRQNISVKDQGPTKKFQKRQVLSQEDYYSGEMGKKGWMPLERLKEITEDKAVNLGDYTKKYYKREARVRKLLSVENSEYYKDAHEDYKGEMDKIEEIVYEKNKEGKDFVLKKRRKKRNVIRDEMRSPENNENYTKTPVEKANQETENEEIKEEHIRKLRNDKKDTTTSKPKTRRPYKRRKTRRKSRRTGKFKRKRNDVKVIKKTRRDRNRTKQTTIPPEKTRSEENSFERFREDTSRPLIDLRPYTSEERRQEERNAEKRKKWKKYIQTEELTEPIIDNEDNDDEETDKRISKDIMSNKERNVKKEKDDEHVNGNFRIPLLDLYTSEERRQEERNAEKRKLWKKYILTEELIEPTDNDGKSLEDMSKMIRRQDKLRRGEKVTDEDDDKNGSYGAREYNRRVDKELRDEMGRGKVNYDSETGQILTDIKPYTSEERRYEEQLRRNERKMKKWDGGPPLTDMEVYTSEERRQEERIMEKKRWRKLERLEGLEMEKVETKPSTIKTPETSKPEVEKTTPPTVQPSTKRPNQLARLGYNIYKKCYNGICKFVKFALDI